MRDSLLSRFRGIFLGALLGEAMGSQGLSYPLVRIERQQITQAKIIQAKFAESDKRAFSTAQATHLTRLMLAQAAILTGLEDGTEAETETEIASNDPVQVPATRQLKLPVAFSSYPAETAILMTLPLALLYHDQPFLGRTVLQSVMDESAVEKGQINSALAAVMVIHQVVSLILRERFIPLELIPQVLKDLDLQESCPALADQLIQAQTWIAQSSDLASVSRHLKQRAAIPDASSPLSNSPLSNSLTLALYCFLSTPDDFRLALLRSAQLNSAQLDLTQLDLTQQSQPSASGLPTTLVGAISGLYNGLTGLPLSWRRQVWTEETAALIERWGIASELEVEQLADRLLACWSGAVDPVNWLQHARFHLMTAAPRAIRPD